MDTSSIKVRLFNPGICLLKLVACFGVVNSHFGTHGGELITLPVPMFIFVSIFVAYDGIMSGGVDKIVARVKRLMFPFWFWGVFYFVAYCVFTRTFELDKLAWQLTFGHSVCKPLFFLPLLLFYTIFVYGVTRLKKYTDFVWLSLIAISFFMQYSGLNYRIFGPLPDEMRFTCGRVFECLPAVAAACLVKKYERVFDGWGKWQTFSVFAVAVAAYLCIAEYQLIPSCEGFTKQGFSLFLGTVTISSAFVFVGRILPQCSARSVLMWLSGLSFGIYLLHIIVARFYELAFGKHENLVESVTIFVVSALAVALMQRVKYLKEFVK